MRDLTHVPYTIKFLPQAQDNLEIRPDLVSYKSSYYDLGDKIVAR